ncbi:pilus assembly protein [Aestuariirhabdus sp. LZHN29]|uniref:pilus assembly protein n=1 Tax=Aestuariirhabdus sp. LZHN29 TaxID=3417462 RepID=UPI003CF4FEDD
MKYVTLIKNTLVMAATSAIVAMAGSAGAAPLGISQQPLFLGVTPDPNVLFVVDDSGSMDWSVTTTAHYPVCAYVWPGNSGNSWLNEGGPVVGQFFRDRNNDGNEDEDCDDIDDYYYSFDNSMNKYNRRACNSTSNDSTNVSQRLCTGESVPNHAPGYPPTDYRHDWRALSSDLNTTYFDPRRQYLPWPGRADMVITSARVDANANENNNGNRNLTGLNWAVWIDDKGWNETVYNNGGVSYPARDVATTGPNGWVDVWDNYVRYAIINDAGTWKITRTPYTYDISGAGPYSAVAGTTVELVEGTDISGDDNLAGARRADGTLDMERAKTNVANWFTYHRKRQHVTKYAVADVISKQPDLRYGFHTINNNRTVDLPTAGYKDANNGSYAGHNTSIINSYYNFVQPASGTPLKQALDRAGRYYQLDNSPMGSTSKQNRITSSCQANYTLLFTDGFYSNSNMGYPDAGPVDFDSMGTSTGGGDNDGTADTLADIARYFYVKDLRTDMDNNVKPVSVDPATWQHMNTFTIAFGVTGLLEDTDAPQDGVPNDPATGDNLEVDSALWGVPNSDPRKIDDLWHAAVNSHGQYISAKNPQEVVDGINKALSEIVDRTGSAAAVAASTGSLNTDTHVYQAKFDSRRWSGSLQSLPFSDGSNVDTVGHLCFGRDANNQPLYPRGTLCPTEWDASTVLAGQNFSSGRAILTNVSGAGRAYRWANLNSTQQGLLQTDMPNGLTTAQQTAYGTAITNYLRGDSSNEFGEGGAYSFRLRNGPLGDVVHSSPQYVKVPNIPYPNAIGSASKPYSSFRTANLNRQAVVYAGANDGMMHAFNADTGAEMLAFVPNEAFSKLSKLARQDYTHEYIVDGTPTIVDMYFASASNWKSVLAAGMGGGGRSIFALDVTDPTAFSEANAASLFLWEYTDNDLGYTYSQPQLVKLNNGKWAAIFGNGYSATGTNNAKLFIVDVETGTLIKKIDTTVGSSAEPNGLSTPNVVDDNGDFIADYVYAGDLQGNLWKFDLTGSNVANWDVAIKVGGAPKPLYRAVNINNQKRPIMAQPVVNSHPLGRQFGYMVYFGTGKFIEKSDATNATQPIEGFYAITDRKAAGSFVHEEIGRNELLQQYITEEDETDFYNVIALRDSNNDVIETPGTDVDGNAVTYVSVFNKATGQYESKTKTELALNGEMYTEEFRISTKNPIVYYNSDGTANRKGWFIDLCVDCYDMVNGTLKGTYDNQAEKQTVTASYFDGVITFNTTVPSTVECAGGGSGWIMKLNATSGARLNTSPFDFNKDGLFDSKDLVGLIAASGAKIDGVPTSSTRVGDYELTVSSDGGIEANQTQDTSTPLGRYKWRQLKEE